MFNEVSLFCGNIFRNISQRTRFLQTEQFLLNIKIFRHGVKSSCKNRLMRLFHEAIQKRPFKIHLHGVGERINCVCGEPGSYPKAHAQAGVSSRGLRDAPRWYPKLLLCSITRISAAAAANTKPNGRKIFSKENQHS